MTQGTEGSYYITWSYRKAKPHDCETNYLLGTVKEVLFDIVTITDDDKLIFTRVGNYPDSGSANDFENFDETSDYAVDDIVVKSDTNPVSLKLYKFKVAHTAGSWNESEVDEYTLPDGYQYKRTYDLHILDQ